MASLAGIIVGTLCLVVLTRLVWRYHCKQRAPVPPRPPGLPILGKVNDIPAPPWLKCSEWCREYGTDIIRLNMLGFDIIVLDTLEAANELLDKRSSIYSGRAGLGWNFGTMDYGDDWRVCRKMAHHEFHATSFQKHRPILARRAYEFIHRLTEEGRDRANIMKVTYGIRVFLEDDPFIKLAETGQEAVSKCPIGFCLVELFPILEYVSAWFPGAGFERKAAVWHEAATRKLHVPYADFIERHASGKAEECVSKALAETFGTDEDVQSCARRELEGVLGIDRLPTFEDLGSVPYLDALIKELLRWHPIICFDLPRKLREDDVYNGFHLENDSIVSHS
ncbi:cytochrome P450 [Dichomitus squalens]|uniref:Cytochrome P450 n=1 Tax=Dichomitus squalens TaxID=114155 RepID=A0A4Q9PCS8_9APHY|nr:cytochrome P450 [Dichomitus squalens]